MQQTTTVGARAAGALADSKRALQDNGTKSDDAGVIRSSVEELAALAERERLALRPADRLADRISAVAGSLPFVLLNGMFFAAWIGLNSGIGGLPAFDPYPFGALTVIVSLEAIFLAIFVLMSQNRQTVASDRRASIDMHVNAIAEREITKVLELLHEVRTELGGHHKQQDEELQDMLRRTDVKELVEAVEEVEQRLDSPEIKVAEVVPDEAKAKSDGESS